jgi:hypothetical protein
MGWKRPFPLFLACEMAHNPGIWVKLLMVWGNGRLLECVLVNGKRGVARRGRRPQQQAEDRARARSRRKWKTMLSTIG